MRRAPIIAGNWKMYKTSSEAKEFVDKLAPLMPKSGPRVFLAVPFTDIHAACGSAQGTAIVVGAQNMHDAPEGAFTGEVSAQMLKEAGAAFVILGHSERRQYFHETNNFIRRKVKRALEEKLLPLLCIGEMEEERDAGRTEEVLVKQLEECLSEFSSQEVGQIVLAYEPIWAIGTGKTATPEIADETHLQCRDFIAKKWGRPTADKICILYGGSVKPETIKGLMDQPNIDGVLVGGASLEADSFAQIVNYL